MSRTTKSEVLAVFERLCTTVGVEPIGPGFATPVYSGEPGHVVRNPGWNLDNAACYGGWTVAGQSPGSATGESRPLGDHRMPAREFVAAMHLAIRAVEASKAGRQMPSYAISRRMNGSDTAEHLRTVDHPILAASHLAGPIDYVSTPALRQCIADLLPGERIEVANAHALYIVAAV